ncbi:MAG: nucleotide sugar dehydrogenase [Spirochaetia bacterium]|nr:nucleotide sugar dehydrogenase [Spirochaetia bacterium]
MVKEFIDKIKTKEIKIGILGLGYVGLPLMIRYIEENFKVIGFDVDEQKVKSLLNKKSYIEHIPDDSIENAIERGFIPTTDFSLIKEADALIICVPTPLNKYREPDLSYVLSTMKNIQPYFRKGHLVSLESTTYPGTTEEELRPIIEREGFIIGEDFFLVYSPEREDPGNQVYNTKTTPKVCGGSTKKCLEAGLALYEKIIDKVVPVSSTQAAEMTKLLENIHRAVNIGLVNEMKIISDKMGIDIYEVINAAATKPFGFKAYYPGPGIGGHCIPIDPFYLTWKSREYGVHTRFIELAGEINSSMPEWVVNKLTMALNEAGKPVKKSQILVLGISYKKNIDDMRESPSVFLMEILRDKGAVVSYSDPHVLVFPKMREHQFDLKSENLTPEKIKQYDCVLLATDHDDFDYDMIQTNAKIIIDTRGKYSAKLPNVIKS